MKCVLQSWLLLEESKARQPYDLQLKRIEPKQKINNYYQKESLNKNLPITKVHLQFGPELRNFSLIVLLC